MSEPVWTYWTSHSGLSWVLAWLCWPWPQLPFQPPWLGAAWLLLAAAEEVAGATELWLGAEVEVEEELPEELAGAAPPPFTTTPSLEPSAVPQVVPPGMRDGPTV